MAKASTKAAAKAKTARRPTPRKAAAARKGALSKPRAGLAAGAKAGAPVRLARVAKGKKPQYFSDPAIDKLLAITLTLAGELAVTRERLDTVERLLEGRKVLKRSSIETYVADARSEAEREAWRQRYVARVLSVVQAELEEMARPDMPRTEQEMVEAVAH